MLFLSSASCNSLPRCPTEIAETLITFSPHLFFFSFFSSVPKERIEVQLQDELSESLRQLKPEGNLLKTRFQSFVERNLIEPRVPVAYVHLFFFSLVHHALLTRYFELDY
jgi:hypothetical protein